MNIAVNHAFHKIFGDFQEISVRYDADLQAVWCYYKSGLSPCFSLTMLRELRQMHQNIIEYFDTKEMEMEYPIRYLVVYSQIPGIYSLGGDLALFRKLIQERNREKLLDYAKLCIELCYLNSVNLHLPITTISLVEGLALGGGFEAALASNILIATEKAEMGFPEIRFNLFPGMGAYSFLARTCGIVTAEKMITSGAIYSAKELYQMGVIHHLVESGSGQKSVENYLRQHQRAGNGHRAIQQVGQRYHSIDYQELSDITEIWADAALHLKDKDLKKMDRLAKAQLVMMATGEKGILLRTKQDRRFIGEEIAFPLTDWSGETIMSDRRKTPDRRMFH